MIDLTGLGSVAGLAKDIIGRIWPASMSDAEKAEAQLKLQQILDAREQQVMAAQRDIIVAEMAQTDTYTKRARPSLVYAGLIFIFLVHVVFPMLSFFTGREPPTLSLPQEFWWAWSATVGIWSIGRSAERLGSRGKATDMIAGGRL